MKREKLVVAGGVAAACAVCCAPLVAPFVAPVVASAAGPIGFGAALAAVAGWTGWRFLRRRGRDRRTAARSRG